MDCAGDGGDRRKFDAMGWRPIIVSPSVRSSITNKTKLTGEDRVAEIKTLIDDKTLTTLTSRTPRMPANFAAFSPTTSSV